MTSLIASLKMVGRKRLRTELPITEQKDRFVALLVGLTVSVGVTNALFSLTDNPTRGFDFHYADVLLPVLVLTGFATKRIQYPQRSITIIGIIVVLSSLWSEDYLLTYYTSTRFAITFLVISSMRGPIRKHVGVFITPLLWTAIISIGVSLYQLVYLDATRGFGISGNPNPTAGLGMFLMMFGNPTGALLIGTTGTRSVLLALVVISPLMFWKGRKIGNIKGVVRIYAALALSVIFMTLMFSTYDRFSIQEVASTELKFEELTTIHPTAPAPWTVESRVNLAKRGIEDTKENLILGSGFDTRTNLEDNPHNMYLLMTSELGLFGIIIILILMWTLWTTRSPLIGAILIAGIFDHYWWTTAQGTFLFASALAISWRKPDGYNGSDSTDSTSNDSDDILVPVVAEKA